MKIEQKRLKTKLTIIFWANLSILLGIAVALLYTIGIDGRSITEQDFVVERFGIIAAIVIIPLSLKTFHSKYKKVVALELDLFLKKLHTLFTIRTLTLNSVVIFNFVGFYFIGALNFIYMAGVTILVFALCYPIESIIDPVEKEIETED